MKPDVIIERLKRAIKAAKASNANSVDVEDNLQEIVNYLEHERDKCPHGYVYKLQCSTCRQVEHESNKT